jgi:hypothetical protein
VSAEIRPQDALRLWLALCAGSEPDGGLLEVRAKRAGERIRRVGFYPTHEPRRIMQIVTCLALEGDVYVGVAPRRPAPRGTPQGGGIDAIERLWTLFVDADTAEACSALRVFEPHAALLINSGNGLHGYWPLKKPLAPEHAKIANRRLAHHLGADMNATDAARIMRPPLTQNWKRQPPVIVRCERLNVLSLDAAAVVGHLPDPPAAERRAPAPQAVHSRSEGIARAALDGAARTVRSAPSGNRNSALNWSAFQMGARVAAGELDEHEVRAILSNAAAAAGLDEIEINQTLASGLKAGLAV